MSNYAQFQAGDLSSWAGWQITLPALRNRPVSGKLFLREHLGLTGMEVSLNSLPPSAAVPFLHTHREHEELYVFLAGHGEFQVDGEHFEVRPGSSVRVAPNGQRSWRNTGSEPLIYMVVQAKANSVDCEPTSDGVPVPNVRPW
jgi:mannose-6-phosphate isomerase-like protein (cupin superfamily)